MFQFAARDFATEGFLDRTLVGDVGERRWAIGAAEEAMATGISGDGTCHGKEGDPAWKRKALRRP